MSDSPITPKDEAIKQSVHQATDKAIDAVSGVAQKAQEMGAEAKEAVTEKIHEVQDHSRIARGRAEVKLEEGQHYFSEKAGQAKDFAEGKVEQVKDFAEEKAGQAKAFTEEKSDQIKHFADEATDKMKDLLADGAEKLKNLTGEVADKLRSWADRDKPSAKSEDPPESKPEARP